MIRLTYISTAPRDTTDAAVNAILASSRRNNSKVSVTGLLLFDGKRFLQALEGYEAAVLATFMRIKADPRHRACVELGRATITERAFGEWDMAWRRLAEPAGGVTLGDAVDAMVAQVEDRSLRALFTGFARIDRSAA
jgi:hypothetical protein